MSKIWPIIIMCLLTACGDKFYTQRVFNESGRKIDDVVLYFGILQSSFGVIPIGEFKAKMSMKTPPPSNAKLTWIDESNKAYSQEVNLSIVPKNYDKGVITFTINKDFSVKVGYFVDKPVKLPATK
jgi:hypothetical protein